MQRLGRELCLVVTMGSFFVLYTIVSQNCDCNKQTMIREVQQNNGIASVLHSATHAADKEKPKEKIKVEEVEENLPPCPEQSPHIKSSLHESIKTMASPESLEEIFYHDKNGPFPPMREGGVYRPSDCKAKQRVAIIIPYRNRYEHLHIQIQNLFPVLRRQQADFRYFIIEQNLPTTFNQGMLFNIGYLEANKYDQFDCYIFSDVDLLPLNDECLYRCTDENPVQLTAAINKWDYNLPFGDYYGGIVAFTGEQFEKINGFSNLYFGWGGVDDDLLRRIRHKNYKKVRYTKEIGRFDMVKHARDKGNKANGDRKPLLKDAKERQDQEGVSSAEYTKTDVELKPLYTWVHVSINMSLILKNAPESTQEHISAMRVKAKKFDELASDLSLVKKTKRKN